MPDFALRGSSTVLRFDYSSSNGFGSLAIDEWKYVEKTANCKKKGGKRNGGQFSRGN